MPLGKDEQVLITQADRNNRKNPPDIYSISTCQMCFSSNLYLCIQATRLKANPWPKNVLGDVNDPSFISFLLEPCCYLLHCEICSFNAKDEQKKKDDLS